MMPRFSLIALTPRSGWNFRKGQEARIFDGDDGLGGEVLDQLDLLFGKWSHLLAIDGNRTDHLIFLEHRNSKYCAGASELGELWIRGEIIGVVHDINDLNRLFCRSRAFDCCCWNWSNYGILAPLFGIFGRSIMQSNATEAACFAKPENAKFGPADAGCVRQHCIKDRLKFAGGA